jgi:hypothetical protein
MRSKVHFGADVDYPQLVKLYGEAPEAEKRNSPAQCIGARKRAVEGDRDPAQIRASFAERQNLTMRRHMHRFTRLTNAFSKMVENHAHAVSLHFMYYNFARQHRSLGGTTPAMAAGVTDKLWTCRISSLLSKRRSLPRRSADRTKCGPKKIFKLTHYRRKQSLAIARE